MRNNKSEKFKIVILILILLFSALVIVGGTFAFFSATANNTTNIGGGTYNFDVSLTIDTIKSGEYIPIMDDLITTSLNSAKPCIDSRNYNVCSIYKLTLTNNGDAQNLNGYVKTVSTTYTTTHLKYRLYTKSGNTYTLVSDTGSFLITVNARNDFNLNSNSINFTLADGSNNSTTSEYYLVIWLSDIDDNQLEDREKTYSGSVVFESLSGANVSANFN